MAIVSLNLSNSLRTTKSPRQRAFFLPPPVDASQKQPFHPNVYNPR